MHERQEDRGRGQQFVLVVDGNARDAAGTGMLLQNFGYTVTTVRSAEDAIELLGIAVPVLVLMDLELPGMNGFHLLARIRKDDRFAKIPVIVQTALPDVTMEDRCRQEGCTLYLRKPIRTEDLYRAVQATIERTPRQNLRITTYLRATVGDGASGTELITVISENGMFIKTLNPREVGAAVPVSFMVNRRVIKVRAAVLYIYRFEDGPNKEPGMGMKFTQIAPEDRQFLHEFIWSQVHPPIPPRG